jgi:hypothetical protein
MSRNDDPDIIQLRKSGNVHPLLRLLNHSQAEVRVSAAEALAIMDLNPGEKKKAQTQISNALKQIESKEAFTPFVPISIGVYKQSLIQLERMSPADALLRGYKVWFDVYMMLLQQHKHIFGNRFTLGIDSDRIRHAEIERIAKRVLSLGSRSTDLLNDGDFQLRFILLTVGNLEKLVNLDGHKYLTMEGHEGDHDWTLSRSVYKGLCNLMEKCSGQKFGLDQNRWSRLRDNILALVLNGEIDLSNTSFLDAKILSKIEKRADLTAPSELIINKLFKV